MKKWISLSLIFILLLFIPACGKGEPDVETVPHSEEIKFGMSKEQVEKITGELSQDHDFWMQNTNISLGVDEVTVSYYFVNDSLSKARYNIGFTEDAKNGIIESLKKKYGEPISDNLRGSSDSGPCWGFTDGNYEYTTFCYTGTMGLTGNKEQVIVMSGKYNADPDSSLYELMKKI